MTLDLHTVKEDFALMVQKVQPWTLSQFVMWLDLKVAEYKVHGYMILDYEGHLNQLFSTDPKKSTAKNGPFTNAATARVRTAPSRNIAKQTSVINIDADSPPPPPTAPAQNTISHLRNTNAQVIDVDIAQSLPSNSRNIQALYARNSQTVESELSVPTLSSPPLSGYSLSKNTANAPTTPYTTHNGQQTMNSNGLRTSLTHPRTFNSNQSQLVNGDNTIIVGSSRGNNGVSYSQHCSTSQQANITRSYVPGEQAYQNQSSVQHIDVDPEQENDLNLVQVEPQMELLMDVECENDYVPENWNSSAALSSGSIGEKRLLQGSIDIKNGNFHSTASNNPNNVDTVNEPVPEIKLEDVKHCTDNESFALNIENSNSCNRLLNTEDCLRIDSDSDIECDNNQESLQESLTEHVWSSEDSAREPSNLPQSVPKRRYMNHRIKPIISLPSFNGYLQNMLESGKAQFVWSKLVEQCAYHILAQKDIREKHDYREFCHALYQRYPSIGLEGPQPWSHFSKTLSQKIRHIRWQHKKRSTLGEGHKNAPPGVNATTAVTTTTTNTTPSTNAATPSNLSAGSSGNNSLIATTNEIKEDISCTTTQMVKKCEDV